MATSPKTSSDEVVENLTPGVDPEEDSSHYMAILIESLSILGRVQDALQVRALTLHTCSTMPNSFTLSCRPLGVEWRESSY